MATVCDVINRLLGYDATSCQEPPTTQSCQETGCGPDPW